jgi:trimethylamine--corrinoid protein Co-methyltransferase
MKLGRIGNPRAGLSPDIPFRTRETTMHLTVLDSTQIEALHQTSLRILAEIGVHIPHDDMRSRFRDVGAPVNDSAAIVRIPESLVARCLDQAGKSFTCYGRDRSQTAIFGQGSRNYNSVSGEAHWTDDISGRRRYASLADVATAARLGDALGRLTVVGAMSDPHELPPAYRCVEVAAALIRNTTKPIGLWFHDRASARYLVDMFSAVAGGESDAARHPITYPLLEPISPLRFPLNGIDLIYETARVNMPVAIGPMAQVGISAPGTLAGTLAQENAEILAGLCITQLIRPGMPVCYGGIPHAFDMRTTQLVFAGPEQALMAVAMTQMGKRYGLPVYINVGLTDSKTVDSQAGMEAAVTLICGALAGADIFGHLGICGVDQATSLDMLVMQHELIGYVERLMQGIRVNDEALGFDVLAEVGPGGTFIAHDHTAANFRRELWFPRLLDREFYDAWVAAGSQTMADRCRSEKERLLAELQPELVAPDLDRELTSITAAARKDLGE